MAVNDGSQGIDINALMAQNAARASSGGGGQSEGGDENNPIVAGFMRLMTRFTGVKFSTMNAGLDAHLGSKGFADGPINKAAASFNLRGGAVSSVVAKGLQLGPPDLSKIAPPDLPRLEVKDAPVDTSINVAPSSFASAGSVRGGGGMDSVG